MEEIWKDIEGYEGLYQVSSLGRVKSLKRTTIDSTGRRHRVNEKILNPLKVSGYYAVWLYGGTKGKRRYLVHRLVAEAFIPNPDNLPQVGHRDEKNLDVTDQCNNNVGNLYWTTPLENNRMPERKKRLSGENNYFYGKHFKGKDHPQYGTHRSPETKAKISAKNKGKKAVNRKKVICDNKIFNSIEECANFYGVRQNNVSRWLSGTRKMPEDFTRKGMKYYHG